MQVKYQDGVHLLPNHRSKSIIFLNKSSYTAKSDICIKCTNRVVPQGQLNVVSETGNEGMLTNIEIHQTLEFFFLYIYWPRKKSILLWNFMEKQSRKSNYKKEQAVCFTSLFLLCMLLLAHFLISLRSHISCQCCKAKCVSKPPGPLESQRWSLPAENKSSVSRTTAFWCWGVKRPGNRKVTEKKNASLDAHCL